MLIQLKNPSATAAVTTLGAELQSFTTKEGKALLWQGDPQYWGNRATVLFPIVGALRQGKTKINGQWYAMGQHGFARHKEFTVVDKGEDFVCLSLRADTQTLAMYPFDFVFTVTYRLCHQGVVTTFTVANTGDTPMPYAVGGHPGFFIPMEAGEQFADYCIRFAQPETITCPKIDLDAKLIDYASVGFRLENQQEIPLSHQLFVGDALVFDNLQSQSVSLVHKENGKGIALDFPNFSMLGIWSPANNAPFVALEPWTGCATTTQESDEFTEKRHMCVLAPKTEETRSFTARYL